jgi:hypothetical protein
LITLAHFQLHAIKLIEMKKIILIPLFVLCIVQVFAQNNWPPIGAKWHYTYRPFCIDGHGCWQVKEFVYYEATSDTVINDTLCTKITVEYHNYKKEIKYLGDEFIFSEGEQVYNYHHGHFNLLHDFSLEPGDSVMLTLGSNCNLYSQLENSDVGYYAETTIKHHITKKDSIEIEGKKYLYIDITTPLAMYDNPLYNFFNNRIIKGIGSLEFLTGNLFSPIEIGRYGNLRCYSDSETRYTTDIPCDYLTSAERITDNTNVYVYPNPVSNQSVICFPNPKNATISISISDMKGKIVWSTETCNDYSTIESENLSKGVYMYRVYNNDSWIGSGKFVKYEY